MITCQFFTFMRGIASEQEDIAKSHKLAAMRSHEKPSLDNVGQASPAKSVHNTSASRNIMFTR